MTEDPIVKACREHKLTAVANTSWPKPFECYTLIDSQDRYVGTIGRNHKVESKFSIQLFDVEEETGAKVKDPMWCPTVYTAD